MAYAKPKKRGRPPKTKVVTAELDSFAKIIQDRFEEAKDSREEYEEYWNDAYDAYRGIYASPIHSTDESGTERGIFVNETARKVNSAKIKIGSLLFDDGRIPFTIQASNTPKFFAPDIDPELDPADLKNELANRAVRMENKIRDILTKTRYNEEVISAIHEMALFGTGVTKGVVLQTLNHPVYKSVRTPEEAYRIETEMEEEVVPTVKFVSIWNIFPSPDAVSIEDAEWVIQRNYMSSIQLREMAKTKSGFIEEAIDAVIEEGIGISESPEATDSPKRKNTRKIGSKKKYEVLEFWGKLEASDLKPHIKVEEEDMRSHIDVVVTVVGDRVIRVAENPFDGEIPYHFCHWRKNVDSIWGDGIWYSIRDSQAILNFAYSMMVEGKTISANPMTVIDPNSFDSGTDVESLYPGKQFRIKPGASVRDAFQPVIIPDVTNGLTQLIQMLERQADLDTGQTAIGYGDQSPSQTKTATGMSILNTNANRQTADIVRSISQMMTRNVGAVYKWVMVDSEDMAIKGDYEAMCLGFENYLSKEVHNGQLINFLQVVGQLPQLQSYLKYEAFSQPLLRAFNLDPELIIKPEEQVQQESQQAQQAEQEAQAKQIEMQGQLAQIQADSTIRVENEKAMLEEKQNVGEDLRKMEMQERLELIKQGNTLRPAALENLSVLLSEVEEAKAQQQQLQNMQQSAPQAPPEAQPGMAQGGAEQMQDVQNPVFEDAMERMQGGPEARDILSQQMKDNSEIAP